MLIERFNEKRAGERLSPQPPNVSFSPKRNRGLCVKRFSIAVFMLLITGFVTIANQAQAAIVSERFAGMVTDNQQQPLASASVSVNGRFTGLTDAKGVFEIYADRTDRYVINATKSGYTFNSVIEPKSIGGNASLKLVLSPVTTITITPTQANVISDSPSGQGTQIKLPADALVDANGNAPTGNIVVSMHTYDLATEAMPGDFSAINKNGDKVALETAGAFWAEFRDASGVKYNLRSGIQAEISIPAINTLSPVGLWSYDEQTGLWKEEGLGASLVDGRFKGSVAHFSAWNFDWQKNNPSCVRLTIEQSLIDAYGSGGVVSVGVLTSNGFQTTQLTVGDHVLYNLLNNASIQLFVPANASSPYTTVNSGAGWGYTGGLGSSLIPPAPYSVCNGSVTLKAPKITLDDGYACITGEGHGVGFSWMLKDSAGNITQNLNAITPVGNSTAVANNLMTDIYAITGIDFSNDTTSSSGEFCFSLGTTYQLFVGPAGATESQMCNVNTTLPGCSFNPLIRWVSKWKKQTSISGRVWNDTNSNGLFDTNETPVSGWQVTVRKPNGSQLTRVTDANGIYELSPLYSKGSHVISGENRVGYIYTTANSATRTIDFTNIPRPVNFGVKLVATEFTLSVSKSGTGTVISSPAGIDCGTDCTENYVPNTVVTLTATPTAPAIFTGWRGDCSSFGTTNPVTVNMDAAKDCMATFAEPTPLGLKVSKAGTGIGTVTSNPAGIDCGNVCSAVYPYNTVVTLTAIAAPGSVFAGWTGGCSGSLPTATMTLTNSGSCTAIFNLQPKVTLKVSVEGQGSVSSAPTGISCGTDCNEDYLFNTQVTLTATPVDANSVFTGWSGDCSGSSPTVTVSMDAAKSCVANFSTLASVPLKVSVVGSGTITSNPTGINCGNDCDESYPLNTQVTLTATSPVGWKFTGWSGNCSGTTSPTTVVMDTAKGCIATFEKKLVDVWAKDYDAGIGINGAYPADNGSEPAVTYSVGGGFLNGIWWVSPDVWVRQTDPENPQINPANPQINYLQHQPVEYGQDNYVRVRVRNDGTQPAINTRVFVYWIHSSLISLAPVPPAITSNGWTRVDLDINHNPPSNPSTIASILPGESYIITIPWLRNNIPQYSTGGVSLNHYCFYIRLENDSDPLTYPLADLVTNVRNNNNVVWRNFELIDLLTNVGNSISVAVENPYDQPSPVDVAFIEPENMLNNDGAKAIVELGELFKPWKEAGARAENAKLIDGTTQVQLLGTPAKLIGIPMQARERKSLNIFLSALKPMPVSGTSHKYRLSVQGIINRNVMGGVDMELTTRALDTDTDGDGIKDVVDLDNNNNGISDEEEIRNGKNPLEKPSQCATYDPFRKPQVIIPCVNVGGIIYQTGMNQIPSSSSMRFEVDPKTLLPVDLIPNEKCAVFPAPGTRDHLRINCLDLGVGNSPPYWWAELKLLEDKLPSIQFDLVGAGRN